MAYVQRNLICFSLLFGYDISAMRRKKRINKKYTKSKQNPKRRFGLFS